MSTIEQIEKLREKANVTYAEAKAALDAASGDMLDAIISLEKQGKVKAPANGGSFSASPPKHEEYQGKKAKEKERGESFSSLLGKFFRWCGRMIAKGNVHMLEVRRHGETILQVPVTVLVLMLIVAFWVIVPLLVVGLFFGFRYFFCGPDLDKTGVNRVMDAAANAAENIKKDVLGSDD
ncbi:MAG: DUF4342 domain-containing protein [Clostridiales bacterium]|nr:DUF4342 domain-containing protein [Clostridiales bacterium]